MLRATGVGLKTVRVTSYHRVMGLSSGQKVDVSLKSYAYLSEILDKPFNLLKP